jgi:hypothetical protein
MADESKKMVPEEDYEALKRECNEKELNLAKQAEELEILRKKANGGCFLKNYNFWNLIVLSFTFFAITFFAYQSHMIQKTLKSIEFYKQKEKLSNDLEINFKIMTSPSKKIEEAEYSLELCNKSSHTFESLETKSDIIFLNQNTNKKEREEIFTYQPVDLSPSDNPICLVKSSKLTATFCKNIKEFRKTLYGYHKPKCVHFIFKWKVKIAKKDYLMLEKHKHITLENVYQ